MPCAKQRQFKLPARSAGCNTTFHAGNADLDELQQNLVLRILEVFMNYLVSFLFWLAGILQFLGMVGGLCFWGLVGWMIFSGEGRAFWACVLEFPEFRCGSCIDAESCAAAGTGPLYPCWWYKEKDKP